MSALTGEDVGVTCRGIHSSTYNCARSWLKLFDLETFLLLTYNNFQVCRIRLLTFIQAGPSLK